MIKWHSLSVVEWHVPLPLLICFSTIFISGVKLYLIQEKYHPVNWRRWCAPTLQRATVRRCSLWTPQRISCSPAAKVWKFQNIRYRCLSIKGHVWYIYHSLGLQLVHLLELMRKTVQYCKLTLWCYFLDMIHITFQISLLNHLFYQYISMGIFKGIYWKSKESMGNLLQFGRNHQLNEWLYLMGFVYQIERPKSGICTQGRRWHRSPVTLTMWCVWGTAPSHDYCLLCPSPTSASGTHGTPPNSVSKLSGNASLL